MKKIALYTLLCATVVASCRKDNSLDIPVEPSFPDPSKQLDSFKTILGTAPDGWVGALVPGSSNQLFSVYLQLDNGKGEATLYSDLSATSAATPSKSPFNVYVAQKVNPTISFGAGSQLGDIKLVTKRGVDTAYAFRYVSGDTLVLLGNKYSDELRLVKAGAQVKTAYTSGKLQAVISQATDFINNAGYLSLKQNNAPTMVYFNVSDKSVGFAAVANDIKTSAGSGYAYTTTGILLRHPVQAGGQAFTTLNWDSDALNFYATVDKAKAYLEQGALPPLPAHYLLGTELSGLQTLPSPGSLALPGWSTDFKAIWNDMANKFKTRGFPLSKVVFDFQVPGVLNVNITFASYVGRYSFKYTRTANGIYTFTPLPFATDAQGSNANALSPQAKPLTDMLTNNRLAISYATFPGGFLIGYTSVDKPSIGFTSIW
ncbi:DUF4302 domain-containing protein [Chitinophaga sp.]|uniref:DUF4302 domain-containing protein n=1 Tax=Chitinophaga sp. TaxID=1869181 RepID=UPI0031CEBC16